MHVITPTDIKEAAIKSYAEMLENPRSFKHKIFLRKQIKQLQNDSNIYDSYFPVRSNSMHQSSEVHFKKLFSKAEKGR